MLDDAYNNKGMSLDILNMLGEFSKLYLWDYSSTNSYLNKYILWCKSSLITNLLLDTGILSMPIVLNEAVYLSLYVASEDMLSE